MLVGFRVLNLFYVEMFRVNFIFIFCKVMGFNILLLYFKVIVSVGLFVFIVVEE